MLLTIALAAALQATSAGPCAALTDRIDTSLKQLGAIENDGLIDNSAPRATMRGAQETALLAEISANIALMQAHRCTPFPRPISVSSYFIPALHCAGARAKQSVSDTTTPVECDRDKWSPAN